MLFSRGLERRSGSDSSHFTLLCYRWSEPSTCSLSIQQLREEINFFRKKSVYAKLPVDRSCHQSRFLPSATQLQLKCSCHFAHLYAVSPGYEYPHPPIPWPVVAYLDYGWWLSSSSRVVLERLVLGGLGCLGSQVYVAHVDSRLPA